MSRTVRHRTPSNGLNAYGKYELSSSLIRHYRPFSWTDDDVVETFMKYYRRDGCPSQVPKTYRQYINRRNRAKNKRSIVYGLYHDNFDNMPTLKWYRDAAYNYW